MADTVVQQDGLFEMDRAAPQPSPEPISRDRKRTLRQAALLARGRHPLQPVAGPLLLHADAAPADDRDAPGMRCGGCKWRQLMNRGSAKDYAKCMFPAPVTGARWRATGSEASDVRAWWPACTDYQPKEPQ